MGRSRGRVAWRWVGLVGLLLGLAALTFEAPGVGLGKEFEIDATVDCGLLDRPPCPGGDTLIVWSDDVSGTLERVTIDAAWVRAQVVDARRGDVICLQVEDKPGGGLRAVSVIDVCDVEGTVNRGASTRGRDVSEQPKSDDDDEDEEQLEATATPTATPTRTPQEAPTATRTPTATVTPTATPEADLRVVKRTSDERVESFEPFRFTAEFRNVGTVRVNGFVLDDRLTLPIDSEIFFFFNVTVTISFFGGADRDDCVFTIDPPDLVFDPPGDEFVVLLRCEGVRFPRGGGALLTADVEYGHVGSEPLRVVNRARIDVTDEIVENNETNNSVTVQTRVEPLDVSGASAVAGAGALGCDVERKGEDRFEVRCERGR